MGVTQNKGARTRTEAPATLWETNIYGQPTCADLGWISVHTPALFALKATRWFRVSSRQTRPAHCCRGAGGQRPFPPNEDSGWI